MHIGLANNYLALGDTARAQGELEAISNNSDADSEPNYQYLLARGQRAPAGASGHTSTDGLCPGVRRSR